jgi:hypothetical protein
VKEEDGVETYRVSDEPWHIANQRSSEEKEDLTDDLLRSVLELGGVEEGCETKEGEESQRGDLGVQSDETKEEPREELKRGRGEGSGVEKEDMEESSEGHSQDRHVINPDLLRAKGGDWAEKVDQHSPCARRASLSESVLGLRRRRSAWRAEEQKEEDSEREDGEGGEEVEEQDGKRRRKVKELSEEEERVDKDRGVNEEVIAIVLKRELVE